MGHVLVRLSGRGRITLPVGIRRQLTLKAGDYLAVTVEGEEVRLRRVAPIRPLS